MHCVASKRRETPNDTASHSRRSELLEETLLRSEISHEIYLSYL
jgi:hypothetical protein